MSVNIIVMNFKQDHPLIFWCSVFGLVLTIVGLTLAAIQMKTGASKKGQKETHAVLYKLKDLLEQDAKEKDTVGSKYIQSFAKYGGAVIIKVALQGIGKDKGFLFDYGDSNEVGKNRVSLYVSEYNMITIAIYDNDSERYELSAKLDIIPNEEKKIMCLWNQEYGVVALFINDKLYGRMKVAHLNIKPVKGELSIGHNREGQRHANMVVFEVRVYSFKSNEFSK